MDGPNCMSGSRGERERTLLSPQERGAVSDPGVAHGAHGQVSLLSMAPDRPPSQSPPVPRAEPEPTGALPGTTSPGAAMGK